MQNYAPATAVTVTAQLVDEAGNDLIPTAVRWRLLDEGDVQLQAWTALAVPGSPTASVVVSALLNTLQAGITRGIRRVEFETTTARGTHVTSEVYLLQGATALAFGVNTFLTYNQALLLAGDFSGRFISTWLSESSRDEQESALIQAHSRIIKLKLKIGLEWGTDQNRIVGSPWGVLTFADLTPQSVADLDPKLIKSLKRAQLIEASNVLTEDGVNAQRNNGLMSMTTGESSQFFRPAKPLDLGICKDAYKELARWVNRSVAIGRG